MPKVVTTLVTTLLLAFAVAVFSGCGEDRSNLLPTDTAAQIDASLTGIQELAKEDCFHALRATRAVQKQVEGLPQSVDPNLKRSLVDGVVALQVLLGDANKCKATGLPIEPATPETEVTPTGDTGVTTPEVTAPEAEKDSGKKDPGKQPETPAPAPEPTPEPSPAPTPETPPVTDPPATEGPGSGGVSPNQ